ncbi:hypothetical protein [Jiella marina]|uniref:hypothetical protein n=1 Tax=Jiella sp. LLJ827 TaxID=2917712 RepID=UPI002101BF96|nr:hypothetical protein [Jiella sp. LLJ827]MCQ0987526.1 hypothetical protein [Jiella sp. LLJ827]
MCVADAFCEATGRKRGGVSKAILNRGARLDEIAAGADIGVRSYERAILWFSEHWPDDLPWPEGVTRPAPKLSQDDPPIAKNAAERRAAHRQCEPGFAERKHP